MVSEWLPGWYQSGYQGVKVTAIDERVVPPWYQDGTRGGTRMVSEWYQGGAWYRFILDICEASLQNGPYVADIE